MREAAVDPRELFSWRLARPRKKFRLRFKHYLLIALAGLAALIAWVIHLGSEADAKFASFIQACDGKVVESAGGPSPGNRAVAFERDYQQQWHVRLFRVPDELTADRAADVAYVVCFEQERKNVVGRCGFREGVGVRVLGIEVAGVSTGGVTMYPRVQHEQPVRVIAPQSGRILAEGVVRGGSPPACDQYTGKPSESTFDGPGVDVKAIRAWLAERLPKR